MCCPKCLHSRNQLRSCGAPSRHRASFRGCNTPTMGSTLPAIKPKRAEWTSAGQYKNFVTAMVYYRQCRKHSIVNWGMFDQCCPHHTFHLCDPSIFPGHRPGWRASGRSKDFCRLPDSYPLSRWVDLVNCKVKSHQHPH